MRSKKPLIITLIVAAALIVAAGVTVLIIMLNRDDPTPPPVPDNPPETVYVIKDGATEYSIFWSNDGVAHKDYAATLFKYFGNEHGIRIDNLEYTQDSTAKEILIGLTDRQISKDLKAAVDATVEDPRDPAWGYCYKDGKLAFYANCEGAFRYGWPEFEAAIINDDGISFLDNLYAVNRKPYLDYLDDLDKDQAAADADAKKEYWALVNDYNKALAKFNLKDYGTIDKFSSDYGMVDLLPFASHPRVYVNEKTLPDVIANLTAQENASTYEMVKQRADNATKDKNKGALSGSGANFSTTALQNMESLAFIYLVTGDELYGKAAVLHALNFIDTIHFSEADAWTSGEYQNNNNAGSAMLVISEVYDWCHDIMSPTQKKLIVAGVCNNIAIHMETGCPPADPHTITSHNSEPGVLRNWTAFALATYDEYPEIYHYVAGKIINGFVPSTDWFFKSGMHHQGSAYGTGPRIYSNMINSILMEIGTGTNPYSADFLSVIKTIMSQNRPDGESLRIGDDYNQVYTSYLGTGTTYFYGGSYYGDATVKAWYQANGSGKGSYGGHQTLTPCIYLILNDPNVKPVETDRYDLELAHYTSAPSSTVTARSAWGDESAWLTYTNMQEAFAANHDHLDTGTFQIYYKGILAPDTTTYQFGETMGWTDTGYGSLIHNSYSRQTISKNGLLVYNPALDEENLTPTKYEQIWDKSKLAYLSEDKNFYFDNETGVWRHNAANGSTKTSGLYSGGQTLKDSREIATLDQWLASEHRAKQTVSLGSASGLNSDGSLNYAYIAGDITNAYDKETMESATRATMTVATGNPDHPMMFLVYDRITATDASFKKTFVLHTTNEPQFGTGAVIDTPDAYTPSAESSAVKPTVPDWYTHVSGTNYFYYDNTLGSMGNYEQDDPNDKYNGKLTATTLLPAKENLKYSYIGGDGRRFWVNGTNLAPDELYTGKGVEEVGWGRVEISPIAESKSDTFLNVMFVSDADNTEYIPAALVSGNTHEGASSFGKVVMFSKSTELVAEQIVFTTEGTGKLTYYIAGLAEGRWDIKLNGNSIGEGTVKAGKGMLIFEADAGEITLTPKFQNLTYILNGGEFEGNVFSGYYPEEDNILPTGDVTKKYSYEFLGWYDNADFNGTPVTEIPANTQTGELTLYAKWDKVFGVLTYHLNGGKINGDYETEKHKGTAYTLPTDVTKTFCEFLGWYTNPEFTGEPMLSLTAEDVTDYDLYARFEGPIQYVGEAVVTTSGYGGGYLGGLKFGDLIKNEGGGKFTLRIDTAAEGNVNWNSAGQWNGDSAVAFFPPLMSHKASSVSQIYVLDFNNGKLTTNKKLPLIDMNSGDVVDVVVDCMAYTLTYYVNGFEVVTEQLDQGNFPADLEQFNSALLPYDTSKYVQSTQNYPGAFRIFKNDARVFAWDSLSIYVGGEIPEKAEGDYKLVLNMNGGTSESPVPFSYNKANGYTLPTEEQMSRYGFSFAGWFDNSELTGDEITEIPAETEGDKTFYAKWDKEFGVISYVMNGGTYEGELPTANKKGEEVTLITEGITKTQCEFLGWYDNSGLTGKPITSLAADNDATLTLYAKFSGPLVYYGPREANSGGYGSGYLTDYLFGDMVAGEGGGKFTIRVDTANYGNKKWEDSGAWANDSGISIFTSLIDKNGGNTKSILVMRFADDKMTTYKGTPLMSMNSGEIVDIVVDFNAKTIAYYVNGVSIGEPEKINSGDIASALHYYNSAKYDFDTELYKQSTNNYFGAFRIYNNNSRILAYDSFAIYLGENVTERADGYNTITFEANGGKCSTGIPAGYITGNPYTLPTADTMEKFGFTFGGWYENSELTGEPVTEISADATGNKIFYAKWNFAHGIITYNLNGGTYEGTLPTANRLNEVVILPTAGITKPHCTFICWLDEEGKPITQIPADNEANRTITAKYDGPLYYYGENTLHQLGWGNAALYNTQLGDLLKQNGGKLTLRIDTAETGNSGWEPSEDKDLSSQIWFFNPLKDVAGGTYIKERRIVVFDFADGYMITGKGREKLIAANSGDVVDVIIDFNTRNLHYYVNGTHKYTENVDQQFVLPLDYYNSPNNPYDTEKYTMTDTNYRGAFRIFNNSNRILSVESIQIFVGEKTPERPAGFYDLALNANGAQINVGVPSGYNTTKGYTLPTAADMTYRGYTFAGWYDNALLEGDALTEIAIGTEGDKTYYAKWVENFGTIEYELDGGTYQGTLPAVNYCDELVELPLTGITKDGFVFAGWYGNALFTGEPIKSFAIGDKTSLTLYARYVSVYNSVVNRNQSKLFMLAANDFGTQLTASGKFTLRIDTKTQDNASWDGTGNNGIRLVNSLTSKGGSESHELYLVNFKGGKMVTNAGSELIAMNSGGTVDVVVDITNGTLTYYVNRELKYTEEIAQGAVAADLKLYDGKMSGFDTAQYASVATAPIELVNDANRTLAYDELAVYLDDIAFGVSK